MQKYSIRENNIPEEIKKELKVYPELLQQLLFFRSIENRVDAERFLNPDYYRDTHNPFLMKDMEKAVGRILKAIENDEKILIYSDYDADGIPGAVVLHDFFKKIGFQNFENYIPHRHNEGYGLNLEAIKEFKDKNINLVITIDCGITDIKEVDEINNSGIDVIITDHHIVGEKIPNAFAILNHQQSDCDYPEKVLSGAGVVFKLIQALISSVFASAKHEAIQKKLSKGWEKWLLDMVGLATISDMVSLKGENRVFSYFGMTVLKKTSRLGLVHLLRRLKIDQKTLTEDDIAFMITPRINVASRIDDPIKSFKLLSTEIETEAGELAVFLDNINDHRKTMVASQTKEANKKLKEREIGEVVVVGSPKWNPGVSGLVATSLVEKYQKTCFVWGRDGNGEIKGSCRSCGEIDVVDLMKNVEEKIFTNIGGHKMAGGFSVLKDKIHLLEEGLNTAFGKVEKNGSKTELVVDKKIFIEDINWENYKIIEKLAPFGIDNPKPLFLIEGVEIFDVRIFGKQNNHLGLDFLNSKGQKISAIQFFSDKIKRIETKLMRGQKVNILVNLEKSTFRNVNELRLRIVDFV